MDTMKALRLTQPTPGETPKLALETLPKPAVGPGQLLIKVEASAIHPSDIVNANGRFPQTKFPRVPGRDFAGVVAEGPVDRIGDEVYGTSGPAQSFTTDG